MNVSVTMPRPQGDEKSLWSVGIAEVEGKNLEAKGRDEVNEMLRQGWILLHIYSLKYKEDDTWRERPMAILGRPRKARGASVAGKLRAG